MPSFTQTRTDLHTALTAALTDARVRVAKYPIRPGSLDRYDALVTIGNMGTTDEHVGMITCDLEVQVGIGDIDTAYALLDEVLEDVDAALPIAWEAANWSTTVDQDDQPTIYAEAEILGHPSVAVVAAGDNLLINGTDSLLINATDALDVN